jgi:RNA polymerase sigma factor (TIGR02999 family)
LNDSQAKPVTALLRAWSRGDIASRDRLLALVYADLRRRAARHLRTERRAHTLQPTALVHEAYLRLVDQTRIEWQSRAQFFAVAAELMRRILVDHARSRGALKRGGPLCRVPLEENVATRLAADVELVDLDDALSELARLDARQARIVEMRFFAGISVEECAEALGISTPTVKREWRVARAWLHRRIRWKPVDA